VVGYLGRSGAGASDDRRLRSWPVPSTWTCVSGKASTRSWRTGRTSRCSSVSSPRGRVAGAPMSCRSIRGRDCPTPRSSNGWFRSGCSMTTSARNACVSPTRSGGGSTRRDAGSGGQERGLVPRLVKLPWIPGERQWLGVLAVAAGEPIRNRVMLALAYDAALRREELCTLPGETPVYPTHGAGSFCSAPPGAGRTTTIGRESGQPAAGGARRPGRRRLRDPRRHLGGRRPHRRLRCRRRRAHVRNPARPPGRFAHYLNPGRAAPPAAGAPGPTGWLPAAARQRTSSSVCMPMA
jgi:hypothetical protein